MPQLANVHPGEILKEEFLTPLNLSAYRLAKDLQVPQTRISAILHHRRGITADTALRLSRYFGTTPQFWLHLQNAYDLEEASQQLSPQLAEIPVLDVEPL